MRIIGGFLLGKRIMRYTKPALNYDQQIDLIIGRGLQVESRERLLHWLTHISYYRLSAYFVPFKTRERFNAGANFDQIAGLYVFDRKLRLILLDGIERIEVFLRTELTYLISRGYGPFGHTDPTNFDPGFKHVSFMEELRASEFDSSESFVMHFRGKYSVEPHLPIWMASELLSFGCISRLYQACHPDIKKRVAAKLGVHDSLLISWFRTLSYVRNVCAHHSRLWNRRLALKPILPNPSADWIYLVPGNDKLYCVLVLIRHCLMRVSPRCRWRERLFGLFDAHPGIDLIAMGIPPDWREAAPWADPK
jgi:abortive infection bacteriophage resistance protein